jgi:HK97 family phage major capsid protein
VSAIIDALQSQRDAKNTQAEALLTAASTVTEARKVAGMTVEEGAAFDALLTGVRADDERLVELRAKEVREAAAAASRVVAGEVGEHRGVATVTDPAIYARDRADTSYFRDLYLARCESDGEAAGRLRRHDKARTDEVQKRALSVVGSTVGGAGTGGAGGDFAPPLWVLDDFAALARPGRKFADSLTPRPLPNGISSVNIPRVATGTTEAIQTTNNSALSQTDLTTAFVSSPIATIGGKQVVSLQLLTQSGIPFDEVVMMDLAADYARSFDVQVISGSGASGQLTGVLTYFAASGTQNVTYTQATPAVGGAGGLYAKIFNACSNIETSRFMAPDTIWMHPRRWNYILSSSDTANRPLVVPAGVNSFNNIGVDGGVIEQGVVGSLAGLRVITDANIPTNTGVGTNQDPILVGYSKDLRVWEGNLDMQTFTATYADSAGVLFRALAFSAAIPSRYATSVSVINGTGLVPPTF